MRVPREMSLKGSGSLKAWPSIMFGGGISLSKMKL